MQSVDTSTLKLWGKQVEWELPVRQRMSDGTEATYTSKMCSWVVSKHDACEGKGELAFAKSPALTNTLVKSNRPVDFHPLLSSTPNAAKTPLGELFPWFAMTRRFH